MVSTLSMENPLFASYSFYALLLIVKTIFMAMLTVRHRLRNKVFPNPEDYAGLKDHVYSDKRHPDVERMRRAHRNDLENILPFLVIGLLFVASEPNVFVAKMLFRIFTAARFFHSFIYVNAVGHRIRGISFLTGTFINICMCASVLIKVARFA